MDVPMSDEQEGCLLDCELMFKSIITAELWHNYAFGIKWRKDI